jgi:hypothetical protein
MAIKFKHGGVLFTADTPEEAAQTRALLKKQDEESARGRATSRVLSGFGGPMGQLRDFIAEQAETLWTPEVFISFIERLGAPQHAALSLLVTHHHVTDEELRKALKVSGNQALAGILSGISKQAATLNIPARSIFSFENLRNAGKRRSTYTVADKFLQIATDMNWPFPVE